MSQYKLNTLFANLFTLFAIVLPFIEAFIMSLVLRIAILPTKILLQVSFIDVILIYVAYMFVYHLQYKSDEFSMNNPFWATVVAQHNLCSNIVWLVMAFAALFDLSQTHWLGIFTAIVLAFVGYKVFHVIDRKYTILKMENI